MVRHLKFPTLQHHHAAASPTSSANLAAPSFSPLSIRIPSATLFHPLISETSPNTVPVSDRIPGFKTSAAFLTSLRANIYLSSALFDPSSDLRIPPSPSVPFPITPDFRPSAMSSSVESLPPPLPSPLQVAWAAGSDPLAGVPPLSTYTATTDADLVSALRLVADSVAQQRQYASQQLIFHPAVVIVWMALLAITGQFLYKGARSDLLLVGTTWTGLITAGLLAIRMLTSQYLERAEQTGTWKWLGKDSDVIITKFGDEVIGAVVVQTTKSESNNSAPGSPTSPSSGTSTATSAPTTTNRGTQRRRRGSGGSGKLRGLIRAWTVKTRYRGKGVGGGLLEEAVELCKSKGVNPGFNAIEFADDHANAGRVIPDKGAVWWEVLRFNSAMDRKEQKARDMLETILEERMSEREKRRSWKERSRRNS